MIQIKLKLPESYADFYQKGLIITDDITSEPILDFKDYSNAITKIITESHPKFNIGIFGEWGTGKTTLMKSIDLKLQGNNDFIIVRFETWLYERKDQFALIPLLKTIGFALPDDEQFHNLKQKLYNGAINFLEKTPDIVSSIISKYVSEKSGIITNEDFNRFTKEFNSKIELLAEVDRYTLYFDGFEDIKNEIRKIRQKNPAFRIIIFVDDLDRCSPKKILEVFESIKIFLGMEGIIYIIGMSHDIVTKLLDSEYKESGLKGEQYIKKLIQIPITLPKWNNQDIIRLVKNFIENGIIHDRYKDIIDQNIELISIAIDNNPREIKRFLNNFIVAYEIFSSNKNFEAKELLVIQAIQLRWNNFYNLLIKSDENFLVDLIKYIQLDEDTRLMILDSDDIKNGNYNLRIRKLLRNFKTDTELWNYLSKNSDTLTNIKDWGIYRRAIEVGIEPSTQSSDINGKVLELLKKGKIEEFNGKREKEFTGLNLKRADLREADLEGVDLRGAILSGANLRGSNLKGAILEGAILVGTNLRIADLEGSNLVEADLRGAILEGADLRGAILAGAILIEADLRGAILAGADLEGANLKEADLVEADLRGAILLRTILEMADLRVANLSNSIIINSNYENVILNENTKFIDAIIDTPEFVDNISKLTKSVPSKINNKKELIDSLSKKNFEKNHIDHLSGFSKLPEE